MSSYSLYIGINSTLFCPTAVYGLYECIIILFYTLYGTIHYTDYSNVFSYCVLILAPSLQMYVHIYTQDHLYLLFYLHTMQLRICSLSHTTSYTM